MVCLNLSAAFSETFFQQSRVPQGDKTLSDVTLDWIKRAGSKDGRVLRIEIYLRLALPWIGAGMARKKLAAGRLGW